jgi:Acetyltransferase (GNAT) domain
MVAPQGPRTAEIAAVLREIEQRRVLLQTFWRHPLRAAEWAAATPPGGVTVSRRAHLLDLWDGWDKVWSTSFTANRRPGVRTAERRGVTVRSGSAGQLLPEFYDLLELATARWARMQHEPRWLTLQRLNRRDPLKKFSSAARCLGGRFRVWIAWVDGRPVAGSVVLQGQNAYYFRGAMDERMKAPRPNDLLMARAIEDACRSGCRSYYMGDSAWSLPPGTSRSGSAHGRCATASPVRTTALVERRAQDQEHRQTGDPVPRLLIRCYPSRAARSARPATPSFRYAAPRCVSTVRVVTNSVCVMSRLLRPFGRELGYAARWGQRLDPGRDDPPRPGAGRDQLLRARVTSAVAQQACARRMPASRCGRAAVRRTLAAAPRRGRPRPACAPAASRARSRA